MAAAAPAPKPPPPLPRLPVWLDCDPGHDDAMAILLAAHSARLELIGISTVAGNQTLEKVTENALRTLGAIGMPGIPVVMGQHRPLMRHQAPLCPEIHGETGLDGPLGGPVLPAVPHAAAVPGVAAVEMFERIRSAFRLRQQRVRLVATAALTNVALLLTLFPTVVERDMVEVVLMGGCLGVGNTGAVTEFNIQTDPEAARIVFESGVRLVMVPLEVTHQALVTTSVLKRIIKHPATPFLSLVEALLLFFSDTYLTVFKMESPPLHDPCAVAFVIAPELFTTRTLRVDIETSSQLSAGQTVVDIWEQSSLPKQCIVCVAMDAHGFWDLMIDAIHRADLHSPLNTQ